MDQRAAGRVYPHTATQAAFLLGGIGTGNFSIGARGELRDWELFNKPAKGVKLPYSFFAIRAASSGHAPVARVLEAPVQPPYTDPLGLHSGTVAGLPHLQSSEMRGEYPLLAVDFKDDSLPLAVRLEAFTPFVPLDPDESGIPCAVLRYHVVNRAQETLHVSVVGSLPNALGFHGFDPFGNLVVTRGGRNEYRDGEALRGISFSLPDAAADSLERGSMALVTTDAQPSCKALWLEGGWFDGVQDFWDDFTDDGALSPASTFDAQGSRIHTHQVRPAVGSVCVSKDLSPGGRDTFTFVIAWSFPNRLRAWYPGQVPAGHPPVVRNHYAARFPDAWAAAAYVVANLQRLEALTRSFHRALFHSTLPDMVIDALAANITVIRSPTCLWLEDGTFASWEGCFDDAGSCEGSCTHVWSYAQTLGFLFPRLEKSLLRVAFNLETDEDGRMTFRTHRIFGLPRWEMLPSPDGQLGTVIRLHRDWKLTGDDGFLRSVWENAARCIDFSLRAWDTDGDFLPDGEQHTTYDIELRGPCSYTSVILLAALKAGAEMAAHLGDQERARRYESAYDACRAGTDRLLWNGEYYIQRLADVDEYRYQYGDGCLSDQLLGQSLAYTAGLGLLLPEERVRRAIKAVFTHNFRKDMRAHANTQRSFALDGESGLVLCSWPRGGRPRLPFVYCDEVWTGVEYQVAAHLIQEGFTEEGLELVEAVRSRYDGVKRNPWDEIECGHHYVRSMASWALLVALSGFHFDLPRRRISFQPRSNGEDFSCFFSTGAAWGIYHERRDRADGERKWDVEVLYGSLEGITINERESA
jgi:non-lysosomal glucosylceramidase